MRSPLLLVPVLLAGCALNAAVQAPPTASPVDARQPNTAPAPIPEVAVQPAAVAPAATASRGLTKVVPASAVVAPEGDAGDEELLAEDEDALEESDASPNPEAESHELSAEAALDGPKYTAELTDAELEKLWSEQPEALGSMSVGFTDAGRLVNGVRFPEEEGWTVVDPRNTWGTKETVEYVAAAIRKVKEQYPDAPPLRVNQMSGPDGGYLRPHKSHQNGRDVDLAFYYPTAEVVRVREREKHIDVRLNWALVKALVTLSDVQFILVDRRVQKVLYDYALRSGEDKEWLDSLFHAGASSIVKHARRHRDHFHVRFYNPRAQELGRRVAPLLAKRPEHNIAHHRIRSGDTLGAIALRYGSSVKAIMRANGLRNHMLRLGRVLQIPLRGPCNRCPVPPSIVVPPRKLPPDPASEPVALAVP